MTQHADNVWNTETKKRQELGQVKQELGAFSNQEMQACPSTPRLEDGTPTETARAPKRPMDSKGPGTYKEALTNINIAVFRETYPEDMFRRRPEFHSGSPGGGVT
jgi:hypothetical protein